MTFIARPSQSHCKTSLQHLRLDQL